MPVRDGVGPPISVHLPVEDCCATGLEQVSDNLQGAWHKPVVVSEDGDEFSAAGRQSAFPSFPPLAARGRETSILGDPRAKFLRVCDNLGHFGIAEIIGNDNFVVVTWRAGREVAKVDARVSGLYASGPELKIEDPSRFSTKYFLARQALFGFTRFCRQTNILPLDSIEFHQLIGDYGAELPNDTLSDKSAAMFEDALEAPVKDLFCYEHLRTARRIRPRPENSRF